MIVIKIGDLEILESIREQDGTVDYKVEHYIRTLGECHDANDN